MAQTSIDLLERARAGSDEALGALLQRCERKLVALVRLRLGPSLRRELDSSDLVQSTLVKAISHFGEFAGEDRGSLMAWLARIAENEIRDQVDFQHRQRRDVDAAVPLDAGSIDVAARVRSALSEAVANEEAERLGAALETLEPDHREVIVLRKLEELSFKEVAARMGRSEDACRMLLARAMVALTLRLRAAP